MKPEEKIRSQNNQHHQWEFNQPLLKQQAVSDIKVLKCCDFLHQGLTFFKSALVCLIKLSEGTRQQLTYAQVRINVRNQYLYFINIVYTSNMIFTNSICQTTWCSAWDQNYVVQVTLWGPVPAFALAATSILRRDFPESLPAVGTVGLCLFVG